MKIYQALSRLSLLKKYSYKFLFIAFLGIHIPLIGMLIYVVLSDHTPVSQGEMLILILILTLLATAATLYILNRLLEPLIVSKNALEAYINTCALPNLPVGYKDEAGILMQKVQTALMSMDEFVQAKEDMITLLSHDLRAPISRTIGLADLLKIDPHSEEAPIYINHIYEENQKQLDLLNFILDKLKEDQLEIKAEEKEKTSLIELVNKSINTLQTIINDKKLDLNLDIPKGLEVRVAPVLFSQVIQNLLHNACKFSFPSGKITLACRAHSGNVHIDISDQGIGFYPSGIEKYFQRFTNYGQNGTAGEKSTGIGLYLSRRIIERHSGSLKGMSSGPNQGAKFSITLPA